MASRDLVNNIGMVQLLAPGNAAASPLTNFTSSILDTSGFESAVVAVNVGTLTGVTGSAYLTFTLQESSGTVGAGFTAVASTQLFMGVASTGSDFGDQTRPATTATSGYPNSWLPAPVATQPNLYTGLLPINSSTQANTTYRIGYIGSQRYIRLLGTFTGVPTTVNLDVVGILGHPQFAPVTSPAPITAS